MALTVAGSHRAPVRGPDGRRTEDGGRRVEKIESLDRLAPDGRLGIVRTFTCASTPVPKGPGTRQDASRGARRTRSE